jgi:hypothetical protein
MQKKTRTFKELIYTAKASAETARQTAENAAASAARATSLAKTIDLITKAYGIDGATAAFAKATCTACEYCTNLAPIVPVGDAFFQVCNTCERAEVSAPPPKETSDTGNASVDVGTC